ncbi:hypothetical protein SAMN04487765_1128 [Tenacibaculum sp. MAR_2010_89]|uniref:hypothetical protein n=1 Tax=Tenacibaculum sp. MAR_2010_89 TaxID=1250198 RepID=UPI00089969CD|nr:hypothetical protein [Tenacibaculum sp. MAR_2010_89]SEE02087.1 hypothetical protein SAMN04487765_1128 [Tenacibaculum sp. MAR_2010_89]
MKNLQKEEKEAITFLIKSTEYAQSKGVFSLLEANNVYKSISIIMPLLEEKE